MVYTHCWYRVREIPQPVFQVIVSDFTKVLPALRARIAGWNGTGDPVLNADQVSFNGADDERNETFLFPRLDERPQPVIRYGLQFECCKTGAKPYDLAVAAFLVIAKHHLGTNLKVASDGGPSDWEPAMHHCSTVLGYGHNFRLDG